MSHDSGHIFGETVSAVACLIRLESAMPKPEEHAMACPRIDALVLISETEVKKRRGLVRQFQEEDDVRFFALSVKAGGAGLNLTAASHVIHFDR